MSTLRERADGPAEIARAFRAAGLRYTPQRHAVLEFLAKRHRHATADEILAAINHGDPRASRATVYNSLHALLDAGLVREVGGGAAARYDANLHRHHHFVCDRCGALEDIDWFDPPLTAARKALAGRQVTGCDMVFRGVCGSCLKSGSRAGKGERA
jgi:Fe2+ or Zn2+ uptake regulation protein